MVIFSAVRAECVSQLSQAEKKADVGFLADERRMNVALTRARSNLWIIGNGRFLMGNENWCRLWQHSHANGSLLSINSKQYSPDLYLKRWLARYFERKAVSLVNESNNWIISPSRNRVNYQSVILRGDG